MFQFRSLVFQFALAFAFVLIAPPQANAQQTRAYAPENLSSLSRNDQTRVISLEYSEQSGGRRIPDDQLRFYLDQVRSGWGFSRIRQDIAQSLRGGHGDRPGTGIGGTLPPAAGSRQITCESHRSRPAQCRTNFRAPAVLVRQLSRTTCIEGRNWGSQAGLIWVNGGCRAVFAEGSPGWGGQPGGHPGNANYSVTCSSDDGRYRTCAWDARYGYPVLIERISRAACIEGRSWGYDGRQGLWVSDGCRARFGARR